jgi:phosphoglycerate dehydrogenase-like enzyme
VVVLCLPLSDETLRLIDARRLALMKADAFLINIGRGGLTDEDALYARLRDGRIGGAAIDVWWRYPTADEPNQRPSRHPFHELPNVIMTPHCSAWTEDMVKRRGADVARNIDRFARGEELANIVTIT